MGLPLAAALLLAASPCPGLEASRPLAAPTTADSSPATPPAPPTSARAGQPGDYRQQLRPTPHGWPLLDHWCVWIEPLPPNPDPFAQRWRSALEAALASWAELLPITTVGDPGQAQVLIWRKRPPLRQDSTGWRASHGRAELELQEVRRQGQWRAEPRVQVWLSPGQAARAIQATALHELGHAFGLWGHSDDPADALAVSPGPRPVLSPSPRDRASLRWLYSQPGRIGR